VSAAILFIVVIALAGLGFVVLKALGGDEVQLAEGTRITLPSNQLPVLDAQHIGTAYRFPGGCDVRYSAASPVTPRSESFVIEVPQDTHLAVDTARGVTLPKGARELVPGSSWGMFTIVCTIPIALFMGLWMYKIRKGRIGEASIIGAIAV